MVKGATLVDMTIGILAYANDIDLLSNNLETVKQHCKKLINMTNKVGVKIYNNKTQYLIIG